jgi:hypothetical protein
MPRKKVIVKKLEIKLTQTDVDNLAKVMLHSWLPKYIDGIRISLQNYVNKNGL